jgi:hypothetical protein
MKEVALRITMKRGLALVLCALFFLPIVGAVEPGVNKVMDLEGTPITSITTPEIFSGSEDFQIAVALEEAAASNGTTVSWDWQVCINSGVCYAPVPVDLTSADGGVTWTTSVEPIEEQAYINYRIILHFEDNNSSTYPSQGFGAKVWSDCWISGNDSGGDGCNKIQETSEDMTSPLPGFAVLSTLAIVGVVALVLRPRK